MRSYEAAVGLQQAGLLQWFVTGFYFRPESFWGRGARLLLNGGGSKLEGLLRGRFHPELSPERVLSFPFRDLALQCVSRAVNWPSLTSRVQVWRNRWFDQWVAKILAAERRAAVLCYDGCALRAFEQAKSLGILSVLDQCTAHIKTGLRLFQEEAERHPEWADSLTTLEMPEWWIEQSCRELELADAVFIGSDYAKRTLLENGVAEEKTFVIPYGAEISRFRPRHTQSDGPFRVLFVGQVTQRKGVKSAVGFL